MPVEHELKLRVASHEPTRARLLVAHASPHERVLETNHLLDTPGADFRKAGCGLRVRVVRAEQGGAQRVELTYKGPLQQRDGLKSREELQTTVHDAATILAILRGLGFHPSITFEKRRESWALGACEVCLDEVAGVGTFVEIEGPDEPAIRAARTRLSLDDAPVEPDTYAALVARSRGLP